MELSKRLFLLPASHRVPPTKSQGRETKTAHSQAVVTVTLLGELRVSNASHPRLFIAR